MDTLIFGSIALKHWYPDLKREPKDLDIISKEKIEFQKASKRIETHWVPSFQYILDNNKDQVFVDPDFLYTIKISHALYDIWWDKTMFDIRFMQQKKCVLKKQLYRLLQIDWDYKHGRNKNFKVKGPPIEFFTSLISRQFPHDLLHYKIKFFDVPMHCKIRPKANDVLVSKSLWDALSYEEKLICAIEEASVFALERYWNIASPKFAFSKGLKQLIISSTRGFFNLFLIENFFEILKFDKKYPIFYKTYMELFKEIREKQCQKSIVL